MSIILDPVKKLKTLYDKNGFQIRMYKFVDPFTNQEHPITVSGSSELFDSEPNTEKVSLKLIYNRNQSRKYHNYSFKLLKINKPNPYSITDIEEFPVEYLKLFLGHFGFKEKQFEYLESTPNWNIYEFARAIINTIDDVQEMVAERLVDIPGFAITKARHVIEKLQDILYVNEQLDATTKEYTCKLFSNELKQQNVVYEFTCSQILKIGEYYKKMKMNDIISKVIKDNLYNLLEVPGFGYKTLDEIYLQDKAHTLFDSKRLRPVIKKIMRDHFAQHNQSFIHYTTLVKKVLLASELALNKDNNKVILSELLNMAKDKDDIKMFRDDKDKEYRLTFIDTLTAENKILKMTQTLIQSKPGFKIDDTKLDEEIKDSEFLMSKETGIKDFKFNEKQREVIKAVVNKRFSIINGYAGTGKTTIMKSVLHILDANHINAIQCAFTGKAADGLYKITKHKATTVHALFKIVDDQDAQRIVDEIKDINFKDYNKTPRLNKAYETIKSNYGSKGIVFILDEYSTLDLNLFAVIEYVALRLNASIIMIGDSGQLPAIHISTDELINTYDGIQDNKYNLTKIERQSDDSNIYIDSLEIRSGRIPRNYRKIMFGQEQQKSDLQYHLTRQNIEHKALELFFDNLENKHYDIQDIVVLSPLNNINNRMNELIHNELLNRGMIYGDSFNLKGINVYQNELIINNVNAYNDIKSNNPRDDEKFSIFNGNVGKVKSIYYNDKHQKIIEISFFNGQKVGVFNTEDKHDSKILGHFNLAYSMTVHKAQGSTIKSVIAIFGLENNSLNQFTQNLYSRQMLYTAVTRASEHLDLIILPNMMEHIVETDVHKQNRTNIYALQHPEKVETIQ